jgi:hypothetical protein
MLGEGFMLFHKYVYGAVPPIPLAVIVVEVAPKQMVGFIGTILTKSVGLKVTRTVSQTVAKLQVEKGVPQTT